MPKAIADTSPLLYLYKIGALDWLPGLFDEVWVPGAVVRELEEGRRKGCSVPQVAHYPWVYIVEPRFLLSEWLTADLGPGEISVIELGLENPDCLVLLDDARAREIAAAAGLQVWGTLRVLLEAKSRGLVDQIAPLVQQLRDAGMWISEGIRRRVLALAKEPIDEEDTP